jgi:hypothetical protein
MFDTGRGDALPVNHPHYFPPLNKSNMNEELINEIVNEFPISPKDKLAHLYFLCSGKTVVYIGKTKSLKRRIELHLSRKQIDFDSYRAFVVPEQFIDKMEADFVRECEPVHNINLISPTTREQRIKEEIDLLRGTINIKSCEELKCYKLKGNHGSYRYFVHAGKLLFDTCRVIKNNASFSLDGNLYSMDNDIVNPHDDLNGFIDKWVKSLR